MLFLYKQKECIVSKKIAQFKSKEETNFFKTVSTHIKPVLAALSIATSFNVHAVNQIDIVSTDSNGSQFSGGSIYSSLSNDGRYLAFQRNIYTGGNSLDEIYLKDLQTNQSTRITPIGKYCHNPIISGNGQYILFTSDEANIVSGVADGRSHLYVYDRISGTTNIVDINMQGQVANHSALTSYAISDNGRFIAYASSASNLVSGDTNNHSDVFLYDRVNLTLERVSLSSSGQQTVRAGFTGHVNTFAGLSDDARYILFRSSADNLSPNNTNRPYIRDRVLNTTTDAVADNTGTSLDNAFSPAISANGRYIAYLSSDSDLPGANGYAQVYLYDHSTLSNQLISTDGVNSANQASSGLQISDSGRYITFTSGANNLIPNDNNGLADSFVADSATGSITRVTETLAGIGGNSAQGRTPVIQSTAENILFASNADNLVAGDSNSTYDIFMADNSVLSSDFELQMSTTALPTLLPAAGGSVVHNVTVKNISSSTRSITLYRRIYAPGGGVYSLGDNNYSIPADNFVNEIGFTYSLPGSFPTGRYQVVYFVYENNQYADQGSYFFYKE